MTVDDATWVRLFGRPDPVILDVGANDGSDSRRFFGLLPAARITCFEPDPRALAKLATNVGGRCAIVPAAVGAVDGTTEFWPSRGRPPGESVGEWDMSGSTHAPTGHLAMHPWCLFGDPVAVDVVRLDTWAATHLPDGVVDLIWADVQGAERDLIDGARDVLARTRYFYTEYSDRPLYDGQPTLREIGAALPGFEVVATFQFDALFRNASLAGGGGTA